MREKLSKNFYRDEFECKCGWPLAVVTLIGKRRGKPPADECLRSIQASGH